ncbi:DMT family transporter [Aurantimonas sp. MSK8Z-1]|uniref:aromatic amino acid exporter YddG n=1 Tax=Mangrovibrevibacter kandeliae TaxID=2968473 RepID=UPI002118915B|nr:DMT family transporter [Aurantimonas sp. MSK8Z-1]MCW4116583.1 DMT family transporter [Aurantimonas sp. MSK8Z-1]
MATVFGFSAVLMWALLALFTARSGQVPPFQMNAMTFAIGSLVGLAWLIARRTPLAVFRQPLRVWLTGVGGLFGYHALYFAALRHAPAAQASLIAYLWPLLIVLGSAMLPGERLRWFHGLGALLGLSGAALIIGGRGTIDFSPAHATGYLLALGCALFWSAYSLLSRRLAAVPSETVAGFCLATALLSLLAHLVFEPTVWPSDVGQWLAILGLGLLPVGAAFYVWDHGVKHGDIQLIGASSYAAPLLSTLVLCLAGEARLTGGILAAAALITTGAALAALPVFRKLASRRPAKA